MTSEEILEVIGEFKNVAGESASQRRVLWEIAYQLAVGNEKRFQNQETILSEIIVRLNVLEERLAAPVRAGSGSEVRCKGCNERLGSYHKLSCQESRGIVVLDDTCTADERTMPPDAQTSSIQPQEKP